MPRYVAGIDPSLDGTYIVVLDQSISVVDHGFGGQVVHSGYLLPQGLKGCARLAFLQDGLVKALGPYLGDLLVVLEGYAFGGKGRQHGLAEWGGILRLGLWSNMVPTLVAPPTTLKKFVSGKGNAPKAIMLREVFEKWQLRTDSDDEADAYSCARLGQYLTAEPRTKRAEDLLAACELLT